jgi:hypothetical protein
MLNLDAIRRRCEAATGEPWKTTLDAVPWEIDAGLFAEQGAYIYTEKEEGQPWPNSGVTVVVGGQGEMGDAVGVLRNEDADFIAHAREDIPALLAETERLNKRLAKAEAVVRAAETRQRALVGVDDSELMHAELDLARSLDAYEAADAHNEKGD